MFLTHKLKKGEDFKTAMRKYKVTDWSTTWNLPQNKSLRSKRKYADKVVAGDTLVILDPKAKLRTVKFAGITYNIPDAEWDTTKRNCVKLIEKKFLPQLIALKANYDADYEYLWGIANNQGWLTGMLAAAVENLSGAKPPNVEMNKVTKAIGAVKKALKNGDCGKSVSTLLAAQVAMKDYVDAAEKYRKKVTNGSTKGVEYLEFTRDNSFILLGVLATGGAGAAAPAAAFTVVEIGVAVGAGVALVKSASGEVGNYLAGTQRSGETIAFSVIADTYVGAAQGLVAAGIMTACGGAISKYLAKYTQRHAPKIVAVMLREGHFPSKWGQKLVAKMGTEATAKFICETGVKFTVNKLLTAAKEWLLSKIGAAALKSAAADIFKSLKGTEKANEVGDKIGAKLIEKGVGKSIISKVLSENKSAVDKALKEKFETLESEET